MHMHMDFMVPTVEDLERHREGAETPEMAAVAHQVEARRHANQTRLISWLHDRELLLRDLDPAAATDIMWSLTSYDIFRALVIERDWPADRYQSWLSTTLIIQLLEPGELGLTRLTEIQHQGFAPRSAPEVGALSRRGTCRQWRALAEGAAAVCCPS